MDPLWACTKACAALLVLCHMVVQAIAVVLLPVHTVACAAVAVLVHLMRTSLLVGGLRQRQARR